jgi:hypothetical protein
VKRAKKKTGRQLGESGQVKKQRAFLSAFAKTGNITLSCIAAKIARQTHYNWIEKDPRYPEKFSRAEDESADYLEAEARRRAMNGIDEPVIFQGELMGQKVEYNDTPEKNHFIPLTVKKYSDTLLIFLMKGARPQKYRDNFRHEVSGPGGKPIETTTVDRRELRLLSADPKAQKLSAQFVELLLSSSSQQDDK